MGTIRGKIFIAMLTSKIMKKMKKNKSSDKKGGGFNIDMKSDGIMKMVGSFTILRISSMGGMVGLEFTKEELLAINAKLNKIKLPKNTK
jgi:hypothetical protein